MKYIPILVLMLSIIACGSQTPSIPPEGAIQTAIAQTLAAQPIVTEVPAIEASSTIIPVPTNTPGPTNTSLPSNTPLPTNTPKPTSTPRPTNTPTPLPQPIYLNGQGNDVLDLEGMFNGPGIIHVKTTGDSNIFVYGFDDNGNETGLLVNEISPIDIYNAFGLDDKDRFVRLEINADGNWEIEIYPLAVEYIPFVVDIPTTVTGKDNSIILINGDADLMIVNSTGESNFFVYGYGDSNIDLVVNGISPFSGKYIARIDRGIRLFTVDANGPWEIEFTAR